MQCWNCNAENDEGYTTCWFCKEPARPPSGAKDRPQSPPVDEGSGPARRVAQRTHTAQRHTARPLEELPPEVRERIRQMQADKSAAGTHNTDTDRGGNAEHPDDRDGGGDGRVMDRASA